MPPSSSRVRIWFTAAKPRTLLSSDHHHLADLTGVRLLARRAVDELERLARPAAGDLERAAAGEAVAEAGDELGERHPLHRVGGRVRSGIGLGGGRGGRRLLGERARRGRLQRVGGGLLARGELGLHLRLALADPGPERLGALRVEAVRGDLLELGVDRVDRRVEVRVVELVRVQLRERGVRGLEVGRRLLLPVTGGEQRAEREGDQERSVHARGLPQMGARGEA